MNSNIPIRYYFITNWNELKVYECYFQLMNFQLINPELVTQKIRRINSADFIIYNQKVYY